MWASFNKHQEVQNILVYKKSVLVWLALKIYIFK